MADIPGGDNYFADTLRNKAWLVFAENTRDIAITEAVSMIGRLVFIEEPPELNLDNAAYEQALYMLENLEKSERSEAIDQGVRSRSVADASESYVSANERERMPGWINGVFYSPLALSWIRDYLGRPRKMIPAEWQ